MLRERETEKFQFLYYLLQELPGRAEKAFSVFCVSVFGNLNLWLQPVYFSENKVTMVGKTLGESRGFFSAKNKRAEYFLLSLLLFSPGLMKISKN